MKIRRQAIWGLPLLAALGASVLTAAPAKSAPAAARPHGLKLLINGKQLQITKGGADIYNPIKGPKLRVVARWKGNITGTGYKIQVTSTEPVTRTWRICNTGTSCPLRLAVPIRKGQQFSWTVYIVHKVNPHLTKILGHVMVCLVRNAKPS